MKKRFIDTWFWATLFIGTEEFHEEATEFFRRCSYQGDKFYTSSSIMAETINLILHSKHLIKAPETKLRPDYAFRFFEQFKVILENPSSGLKVEIVNHQQITKALGSLKDHFRSVPKLGYVDCESVVICQDLSIPGILTADPHCATLGIPIDAEWLEILNRKQKH
jgi:predicted nucleic acid-binding protein